MPRCAAYSRILSFWLRVEYCWCSVDIRTYSAARNRGALVSASTPMWFWSMRVPIQSVQANSSLRTPGDTGCPHTGKVPVLRSGIDQVLSLQSPKCEWSGRLARKHSDLNRPRDHLCKSEAL